MWPLYKILEEVDSAYNSKIQVVRTLEGVRILSGGVSQSGWLLRKIWQAALKRIKKDKPRVDRVLILGLGGGSVACLLDEMWPASRKVAVDIDPLMVELGRKYLSLGQVKNLKIKLVDAAGWVSQQRNRKKFDLVLVDLYKGDKIPAEFLKKDFVKRVYKLLAPNGVAAFNHFYAGKDYAAARKAEKVIRSVFPALTTVTPEANIIFIAWT